MVQIWGRVRLERVGLVVHAVEPERWQLHQTVHRAQVQEERHAVAAQVVEQRDVELVMGKELQLKQRIVVMVEVLIVRITIVRHMEMM